MTIPQIKRDNLCPWSQELHLDEKLEITSLVSRQFYLLNGKNGGVTRTEMDNLYTI